MTLKTGSWPQFSFKILTFVFTKSYFCLHDVSMMFIMSEVTATTTTQPVTVVYTGTSIATVTVATASPLWG